MHDFKERLFAPLVLRLAGVAAIVLDIALYAGLWHDLHTASAGAAVAVALLAAAVVAIGSALVGLHITTEVRDRDVRLALWPYWRTRLQIGNLSSRPTSTSPKVWGGIGMRRARGPSGQVYRALLFDAGPALQMLDNSTGITFVVRSGERDRLLDAILQRVPGRADSPTPRVTQLRAAPVDPAIEYPSTYRQLRSMVPITGEAQTVQAELLRAAENLEDEARRNGNQNWGDRHDRQLDFLQQHLADGTLPERRPAIRSDLQVIARVDAPETDPAVWMRLINASCAWAVAHPTPQNRTDTHRYAAAVIQPEADTTSRADQARMMTLLLETSAAWMCGLESAARVVKMAAALLPEIDDDAALVAIGVLPPRVDRADLEPAVRDLFFATGHADCLKEERIEELALAHLCREYLAGEVAAKRILQWAGSRENVPFRPFVYLDRAADDGMSATDVEHELRDRAAALLLGQPARGC
jgi:hypothetical protein